MVIKINPDITNARHLRIWYDAGGRLQNSPTTMTTTTMNSCKPKGLSDSWKTIAQIENEKLGRQGHADYVSVKALCMHIADDRIIYMVC